MFGRFCLRSGELPARRALDMVYCLTGFARRCRTVLVLLAATALALLLAS